MRHTLWRVVCKAALGLYLVCFFHALLGIIVLFGLANVEGDLPTGALVWFLVWIGSVVIAWIGEETVG